MKVDAWPTHKSMARVFDGEQNTNCPRYFLFTIHRHKNVLLPWMSNDDGWLRTALAFHLKSSTNI
jgi:hypothetical protein